MNSDSLSTQNRTIDGPHGPLRVRIYEPETAGERVAGLVWVHGGAFAWGELDMPEADWVSRQLALVGIPVISVDYQLAGPEFASEQCPDSRPGVLYPIASEEVAAAYLWAQSSMLGVASDRWSLGGASAGGNLAAGAALRVRDARGPLPRSLVLAYPATHAQLPAPRAELAEKTAALPLDARFLPETVDALNLNYVGSRDKIVPSYAFPGGMVLQGLPPTFVLNSDVDDLRSSGEAFASELAHAGVDVLQLREDGTRHGHLNVADVLGAVRSIERIVTWLRPDPLVGVAHESAGE